MTDDSSVYPGTRTLINLLDIRDRDELEDCERLLTANRLETLPRRFAVTANGYRQIHRYLFQDLYPWAGRYRTVNIAKGNDMFCLVPHIASQMDQRFAAIRAENNLKGLDRLEFANRAAEHVCELNAIHPFREGNGRTLRAFLEGMANQAGHRIDVSVIDPRAWNAASISSFRRAAYDDMERVILDSLAG